MKSAFLIVSLISASGGASAQDYVIHSFKKLQLSDLFWSEGAHYGDFNKDGNMDVVAGPYWWEGPDFKTRHEYYPAKTEWHLGTVSKIPVPGFEGVLGKNNTYSDNFFAFTYDLNKDGWDDILIIGFPGKEAIWYENPKKKQSGAKEHWKAYKIFDVVDNESPTFADLTGDGKPEIICGSNGYFGYAEPDWSDITKPWTWHSITPKGPWQRFTHGLGFGDLNGDGKSDIMEMNGWWEQPAAGASSGEWMNHKVGFAPRSGGAQMYAYDVNGDGLNDVITSLAAHGYGLAWYEQVKADDKIDFKQRLIMGDKSSDNKYGVKFSQLHAIDLVDMDGDGLKDIVTGKRIWAHGPTGDADPNAAAVLYWFKLVRGADGSVDFIPYVVDNDSGVGTQVVAGDINGDKLPDIVVGNKKGVFVFIHQAKKVGREEWEKAQPKPQVATAAR
jgi:hypothetical protein